MHYYTEADLFTRVTNVGGEYWDYEGDHGIYFILSLVYLNLYPH